MKLDFAKERGGIITFNTSTVSIRSRNRQVGEYVYPEEIVFEIEAPSPNLLAVEQGTETELLEAIKDLPEEYQRLIGIYPVEPQPTRTGFASEQDEVVLYHGTATANVESILQEGLRPDYGWAIDSFKKVSSLLLILHPLLLGLGGRPCEPLHPIVKLQAKERHLSFIN